MTIFSLDNVSLKRGGKTLLKNINFTVEKGEIFSIFGPSGAGKSSLLRLLNRLYEPETGKIFFNGKDIREYDPGELRKRVGMVFQIPVMFEGTVEENLKIGADIWRINIEPENLLEMVQLNKDKLHQKAERLSVGEAQRVAIARTLALEPEVLLMDEPTSALDPATTLGIENLVKSLNRELELTVIFVSHNIQQIERLGGRGLLLVDGEIKEIGKINQILKSPETKEMMKFLSGEKL